MTECGDVRLALGVYVLGAIDPAERTVVDEHLAGCRRCRDELASLAGLPALLGRVTEEQLDQVAHPPRDLLGSLLARAADRDRAKQRTQRLRFTLAAAAAAVLVAGAGIFGATMRGSSEQTALPRVSPTVSASDPATHVSALASVVKKGWGTAVDIGIRGVPAGYKCKLLAVAKNGDMHTISDWTVSGNDYAADYAWFNASTMIPLDQLSSLQVRTLDGRLLVKVDTT